MLKKTIKYKDFDGNEREEDFYFNLTAQEVTEWESSETGGLSKLIEKASQEQDATKIIPLFKGLILMSYGEKSNDGKYFVKNDAVRERFVSTQAFSDLFMELGTNAEAALAFINGIVPDSIKQDLKELGAAAEVTKK